MMKRTVVLLSGGLDSAITLFYAKEKGYKVSCLIFDYSQRHKKEIHQAIKISKYANCDYQLVKISFPWKGSSLLDQKTNLPCNRNIGKFKKQKIPSTYVPARNIIFLSFATSFAETIGADTVFIGANAIDYSGYPDCRPEFYEAYQKVIKKGMKSGVEGKKIEIKTPLIHKKKSAIIKLGLGLKVPYELTWSCYKGGRKPCGRCDSCILRQKGFDEVKAKDPLL